jgi:transposase
MKPLKDLVYQTIKELSSIKPEVNILDVTKKTDLSYSTVHKWVKILELEGKIQIEKRGGSCNLKVVDIYKQETKPDEQMTQEVSKQEIKPLETLNVYVEESKQDVYEEMETEKQEEKLNIHKEINPDEKFFLPLLVMKGMQEFDQLNNLMTERFGKKFLISGESKYKNFRLKSDNLMFEWEDDITSFKLSGRAVLYKKSLLREEVVDIFDIEIDRPNGKFEIIPDKKRDKVLSLLCLLIMEAIRNFAREVKRK